MKQAFAALGILAVIGLFVLFVIAAVKQEIAWNDFAAQHCHQVAFIKGRTFTGIGSDGKSHVTFESDRKTWKCDDGMEYTR